MEKINELQYLGEVVMINIIRLIYAWLLPPGLFVLILLCAYIWSFGTGNNSFLLAPTLIIYLLSIRFVSYKLIKPLEDYYKQPKVSELKDAQAIIILGGGCCNGAPDFDGEGQIPAIAANRFLMGLRLHNALHLPLILPGGSSFSQKTAEAEVAARTLRACGIEDKNLIIERKSCNTSENAKFTKQLCQAMGFKKVILVTSASHLPRSTMLFRREGMDVVPYPSDFRTDNELKLDVSTFTPNRFSLNNTSSALKEYLGILAIKLGLQ